MMDDFFNVSLIVFISLAGVSLLLCLCYTIVYQCYLLNKLGDNPPKRKLPHYHWVVAVCVFICFFSGLVTLAGWAAQRYGLQQPTLPEPVPGILQYNYNGESYKVELWEDTEYFELPLYARDENGCDFLGWYYDSPLEDGSTFPVELDRDKFKNLRDTKGALTVYPVWDEPYRRSLYVYEEFSELNKQSFSPYCTLESPYASFAPKESGYYIFTFDREKTYHILSNGVTYTGENGEIRVFLETTDDAVPLTVVDGNGIPAAGTGISVALAALSLENTSVTVPAQKCATYRLDLPKGNYTIDTGNDALIIDVIRSLTLSRYPLYATFTSEGHSTADIPVGARYKTLEDVRYIMIWNDSDSEITSNITCTPIVRTVREDEAFEVSPQRACYAFTSEQGGTYKLTRETGDTYYDYYFSSDLEYISSARVGRILLAPGETIYLYLSASPSLTVKMTREETDVRWYIDGERVYHTAILPRRSNAAISCEIDGVLMNVRIVEIHDYAANRDLYYSDENIIYYANRFPLNTTYSAGTVLLLSPYTGSPETNNFIPYHDWALEIVL